jgi:hypothetical protein
MWYDIGEKEGFERLREDHWEENKCRNLLFAFASSSDGTPLSASQKCTTLTHDVSSFSRT